MAIAQSRMFHSLDNNAKAIAQRKYRVEDYDKVELEMWCMKRRMLSLYHTCKCRKKTAYKDCMPMAYVRHFARSHHRHVIEGLEDVEVDFFHCINSRILFTKMWSCSSKARAKTESVNFHEKQTGKKRRKKFLFM